MGFDRSKGAIKITMTANIRARQSGAGNEDYTHLAGGVALVNQASIPHNRFFANPNLYFQEEYKTKKFGDFEWAQEVDPRTNRLKRLMANVDHLFFYVDDPKESFSNIASVCHQLTSHFGERPNYHERFRETYFCLYLLRELVAKKIEDLDTYEQSSIAATRHYLTAIAVRDFYPRVVEEHRLIMDLVGNSDFRALNTKLLAALSAETVNKETLRKLVIALMTSDESFRLQEGPIRTKILEPVSKAFYR